MTLILASVSQSGILVAGDTNVCVSHAIMVKKGLFKKEERVEWPSAFVGHHSKICVSRSGICVASLGYMGAAGDWIQEKIESIVSNSESSFDDLKSTLTDFLRKQGIEDTTLIIAGYDLLDDGTRKARLERVFMDKTKDHVIDTSKPGILVDGAWKEVGQRILRPYTQITQKGKQLCIETSELDMQTFSIDDFARLSLFLIRATETYLSFTDELSYIGGPVDMILLRPDGQASWFMKHNPATSYDVDLLDTGDKGIPSIQDSSGEWST